MLLTIMAIAKWYFLGSLACTLLLVAMIIYDRIVYKEWFHIESKNDIDI